MPKLVPFYTFYCNEPSACNRTYNDTRKSSRLEYKFHHVRHFFYRNWDQIPLRISPNKIRSLTDYHFGSPQDFGPDHKSPTIDRDYRSRRKVITHLCP